MGAGVSHNSYRVGAPLTYSATDAKGAQRGYVNERAISTQYTGWHFTAQVLDHTHLKLKSTMFT